MPREITNVDLVNSLSKRRQMVDAWFAKEVYNVFNSGVALQKLQKVAQAIIKTMAEGEWRYFKSATDTENKLRLWQKMQPTISCFQLWLSSPVYIKKLDATDCADVIRLAGQWIEDGGLDDLLSAGHKDGYKDQAGALKKKEPPKGWQSVQMEGYRGGKDNEGWSQKPGGGRQRNDGVPMESHLRPYVRDPNAFTGMASLKKRASMGSWTLYLDQLFGLVPGCDISGTTSDTVFGFDRVLSMNFGALNQELTAHYYMAPMGTIVANFHHTLLEVALPLCQNHELDYHIGFFDTLKPTRSGSFPQELQGIQTAMAIANAWMKGEKLYFFRWYENNFKLKGAFQFQPDEIFRLRYSPISKALFMYENYAARGAHTRPNRDLVVNIIRRSGGFDL